MIRNLKIMGLALVALFAMSAMVASAASAHTPAKFTTSGTMFKGEQHNGVHQFFVTGQEVTCTNALFEGPVPAESPITKGETAAAYSACKAEPLGIAATVTGFATVPADIGKEGKCWYVLNADTSAELKCNKGEVTVDAGPCVVHVPPQTFPVGSLAYTNVAGPPADITMHINVKNIKATHTDGFLCPFGSSGEATTAELKGTATVKAFKGVVQEPLSWDATIP